MKKTLSFVAFGVITLFLLASVSIAQQWEFNTFQDREGWRTEDCGVIISWSVHWEGNGALVILVDGKNPYIVNDPLAINAANYDTIRIAMVSHFNTGNGTVSFKTSTSPNYNSNKMTFQVNHDNNLYVYEIRMSTHPNWKGTITGLRISPATEAHSNIAFDYIRLVLIDPPKIEVSPASHNYGDVYVDESKSKDFTVTNIGGGTLSVTQNSITSGGSDFQIVSGSGNFSLGAGQTRTVRIKFQPSSEGSKSGTWKIVSNASNQPTVTVSLSGNCIPKPKIQVSPSPTYNYGDVYVDESKSKDFTVTNIGGGTLSVTQNSITSGGSDFQIVSGSGNFSLGAGQTRTVRIKFQPSSEGSKSGTWKIVSNASNQPTVTVSLSGNCIPKPKIQVSPSPTYNYGDVDESKSKDFTVTNIGGGTLSVTQNSITSGGSDFQIVSGSGNFSLGAGQSRTVSIKFQPSSEGSKSGTWKIVSNATNQPTVTVSLSGNGIEPIPPANLSVTASPSTIDIGNNATIDINIEEATNLGGFEFELHYNGIIIQIEENNVQVGAFVTSTGRSVGLKEAIITGSETTSAVLTFRVSTSGSTPPGPDGNGVLATIVATGETGGTTSLSLANVIISQIDGTLIPNGTIQDGQLTVIEVPHTVTITSGPTANPNTVSSGGTVSLSVTATDSQGHSINYSWTVTPNEGNFSNPNSQNPTWTAPVNNTGADKVDTLTVTAKCAVDSNVKDTKSVEVTVRQPTPTVLEIFSGDNQIGGVGSVLPHPLVVRVLDQFGMSMEGVTVNFEPSEGASVNPAQATTNENGRAQTILTLGAQLGQYNVTASVEGLDPIVFTATAIDVKADVITLGDAEGIPGEEVRIPLYIQDVSGTPLDADDPSNKIAAWSIQFATNENYEITDVERAGITENMEPAYGQFIKATNTWSLIYNAAAGNPPPAFTLDEQAPGDLVGNVIIHIADIELEEDITVPVEIMPQTTTLSNEGGTVGESVSNGTLQFVNGELTILSIICGDTNGDRNGPGFLDVVYLFNYVVGGGPSPEPLRAGNVNGIGGVDFLDVVYLFNHVVAGGPKPNCEEITTLVTAGSTPKTGTTKDFLTLGEITARVGETVRLPLYLQDVSGTPLDADDAGNKIATWMIAFSTNEKYEIMDVQRAGIAENLEPAYGQFVKSTNTWSLIYNTAAGNPPPEFTLDKPSPGDLIGELVIKLAEGQRSAGTADENAEGDLSVEISAATLSNEAGTVGEFLANNTLGVVAGIIHRIRPGDVSGDKNVTAYDASLVLQYVVGLIEHLPNEQAADVTGDETISALDAALILQYTVGLITSFPVDSAPVAPALNPKNENQVLVEAIKQLESISLTKEPKQVLEQLKNLISKQLLPKHTVLLQNYPNPFNPSTWLPYKLATDAPVTISIYNKKGQLVRKLHLGNQTAGNYFTKDKAAYWDGSLSYGEKVASGVYYYTLEAGEFRATRKMLILK